MTGVEDEEDKWWQYLQENLQFPFKAVVSEGGFYGDISKAKIIEVHSLDISDSDFGIIMKGKKSRTTVDYPLCDLEAAEIKSPNHLPISAYSIWFDNR
ncbi:MAG: calcium-binding protein [Bacteroidetes bacterium]|jgi:hypothetical protein|nr:calcium-binding protein [Bacteroidota bacterium]